MDMMGSGIYFRLRPHRAMEILDWYHLKENLYKVGGSLKRTQAEALLWQGKMRRKPWSTIVNASKPEAYLDKHRTGFNYAYHQAEQLCSIGSGAVESAVKQIDRRLQISGAKWNVESVKPNVAIEMRVSQRSTLVLTVFA